MVNKKFIGTPGFIGERLTQAREARGLTSVSLADLAEVSPTTISQYEHNIQSPRPETLEKISLALNLNKLYFIRKIYDRAGDKVFYRSMSSATKSSRLRAERRFEWLKEIVSYLKEYFEFSNPNLPRFDVPSDFRKINKDLIERYANECRDYWGLGKGPISNAVGVLERNGIVISRGTLEAETLDAFSECDINGQLFIFLGSDKNVCVRSRFDACHELAHLIMHRFVIKKNITLKKDFKLIENQAHYFSTAFLLPADTFSNDLWAPTLDSFRSLKGRWKVSIGAMIKRCEELGIINEEQVKRLYINWSRRGWRKREPLDDSLSVERPMILKNCIEALLNEGIKSKSQFLEELCLQSNDIEELMGLEKGFLKEPYMDAVYFPELKEKVKGKIIPINRKA